MYIGIVVSLFTLIFFINNKSRKLIILICYGLCFCGSLTMVLSQSMAVANVGLFILGLGTMSPLKFSMPFISEITES